MKKTIISAAVAAVGVLGASAAFAQAVTQSTVIFRGEVTSQTCSIDAADRDKVVTLPTVSTSALDVAGKAAGSQQFDIKVSNCSALPVPPVAGSVETNGIRAVAAHFETTNWDSVTGNVLNATGTGRAQNVQVRLYNMNGMAPANQIRLGSTGLNAAGQYFPVTGTGVDRGATMSYVASYYATAPSVAGTVDAVATYTLAYQ
ncbi:fimbrial protein [Ralstonia sp. 25C]|uniref:fimbrial protein n=1 Tax=Ralstonia sp. 25C TaxID=3447363 RepID=UPI003F75418E